MAVDAVAATISELSPLLRRKKISPVELTQLYLERAKRLNPLLNAYTTLTEEQALADAARAEREIHQSLYRGPLHGVPFSIKYNLSTRGVRTTAGSKILADCVPDVDATAVQRLKDAGAILLGKTNMHEWALGGTTSGGSAAAVAADLCLTSARTAHNPCVTPLPCVASSD